MKSGQTDKNILSSNGVQKISPKVILNSNQNNGIHRDLQGGGGLKEMDIKVFSISILKRGVDTPLHPPFDATDLGELG